MAARKAAAATLDLSEDLIAVNEAARILGVSVESVRHYADSGELSAMRVAATRTRLFKRGDVEEFAAARAAKKKAAAG